MNRFIGVIVILVIAIAVLVGLTTLIQQRVVRADSSADEFSAERAMTHIRAIAEKPHPIGSPEIAKVREYILEQLVGMGLAPEVQQSTALISSGGDIQAADVQNIIAKIPGTNSTGAILMDAHYDSVPMTPGAADCGSCVATLLETTRALLAGPPLQNDVILVFTDDEELDPMAGAHAFVEQHPWVNDVGLVLNFEAIGSTGPSIMFEAGSDSGWLVREWSRVATHPVAQSWLPEVYRLTPINTDFTKYSDVGIAGLNFWNMFDRTVYHTRLDNPETIDLSSVQHHGYNALSLIRHVGSQDLRERQSPGDAVYFTLFRGFLINYPASWAIFMALVLGLLMIGIAVIGLRRRKLSIGGSLLGLLAFLLTIIAAAGLATGIWMGINQLHGEYQSMLMFGRVYNANLYLLAFITLSLAIAATIHVLFRRKVKAIDLYFGALLLLWLLALATSILLPGFSYLFTWPLLFSALALGWVLWRDYPEEASWKRDLVLLAGVVPGIIIIAPAVIVMFQFGPMYMIGGSIFIVAVLLGLLTPQIDLLTRSHKWLLSGLSLIVAVMFLVVGSLTAGFDAEHPRPNGMAYILNADSGQATWFSPGPQTDAWTTQFYSAQPEHGTLGELFPIAQRSRFPVRQGEAPFVAFEQPEVEVLDDQTNDGVRKIRLRLSSTRQAPIINLDIEPREAVYAVSFNGQRMETPESNRNVWNLSHRTVPDEGIEIVLEVDPDQVLTLQLSDISRELPDIPSATFRARSADMMPMGNFDYGTVVVTTSEIS